MRHDMSKIITEPARSGVGYYRNLSNDYRLAKRFKLDDDGNVNDEFTVRVNPIRSRHVGWEGKSHRFAYHTAKRFITANIGRVWNDVYSEIAEVCKTKAAKALDLRSVFMNNVEIHTFIGDDSYVYYRGSYRGEAACAEQEDGLFYVDPRDGTLRVGVGEDWRASNKRRDIERAEELAKTYRKINGKEFQKIEDVWFEVRTETVRRDHRSPYITNIVYKRTCSKAEIRLYGLN